MVISPRIIRLRPRSAIPAAILFVIVFWSLLGSGGSKAKLLDHETIRYRYPLAWEHIQSSKGGGGAWYIPPEWQPPDQEAPQNILDAARIASDVARANVDRKIPFSNIPLIVHQKWNDPKLDRLNSDLLSYIEQWLTYSVSANETKQAMAYFFWGDEGVLNLIKKFEPDFVVDFENMFSKVEQVDIFRILVCKWFGGIYGDVDTVPLQHPATWIREKDITAWTDDKTGQSFGEEVSEGDLGTEALALARPVNLLWGIEADTDPRSDSYWRMGYAYPLQLTNWALASAPQHPILYRFMDRLQEKLKVEKKEIMDSPKGKIKGHDPLTRTGPAAVTDATSTWLRKQVGLRWNALTGLKDGGRSKLASDVMVLPITGFSPGRGKYGNMGSRPYTDPDARLAHHAMGSWHRFDPTVEFGKFCRTFFGMCKEWSKVPA